jgi:hypothetical protein
MSIGRAAALLHGVYYGVGGAWPLVNIRSFEKITGGKWDDWLVRTVAWLMVALAGGFLPAARTEVPRELKVIGLVSSASVGGIAAYYGSRGRISKLYLLDAVVQFALAALWLRALTEHEPPAPRSSTPPAPDAEKAGKAAVESIV